MAQLKDFQTGAVGDSFNGPIGATTASTGAFTTLSASSTLGVTGVSTLTGGAVVQGLTVGRGAGAVSTNTAVGASAFSTNTTGANSVAVGAFSLGLNSTGNDNTVIGYGAGYYVTGSGNTGVGRSALSSGNSGASGGSNTAVGYYALQANTTASNNTAVGYQAGYTGTTASAVTFVGYQSGYLNTGDNVTGLGSSALYNNTGADNTAVGQTALYANTSGAYNTAVGRQALRNNTTASYNIALGYQAGNPVTTGTNNVLIGYLSGATSTYDLTTGSNNICIGGNRVSPAGSAGVHQIVLGTAANVFGKGDSTGFISPNGGGVYQGNNSSSWSTTSDQRLKKNIADNNDGLDKINSIRVRNFEYRLPEEVTELNPANAVIKSGVQLGVIAQELQAVLPECVKQESTGVLSVDTDNLTWYLINAVKQLSARIQQLEGN